MKLFRYEVNILKELNRGIRLTDVGLYGVALETSKPNPSHFSDRLIKLGYIKKVSKHYEISESGVAFLTGSS